MAFQAERQQVEWEKQDAALGGLKYWSGGMKGGRITVAGEQPGEKAHSDSSFLRNLNLVLKLGDSSKDFKKLVSIFSWYLDNPED